MYRVHGEGMSEHRNIRALEKIYNPMSIHGEFSRSGELSYVLCFVRRRQQALESTSPRAEAGRKCNERVVLDLLLRLGVTARFETCGTVLTIFATGKGVGDINNPMARLHYEIHFKV